MTVHLCGFAETIDNAGAYDNIAALVDSLLATAGDNLTVPTLNQAIMMAAGVPSGALAQCRLDAPTLRQFARQYIGPTNGGGDADAVPNAVPNIMDLRLHPRMLARNELLQAFTNHDTTSAQLTWILLWLADAPPQKIGAGEAFTIRLSGAATLTVDVWTLISMTLDDALPVGRYAVIGMHPVSLGCVAARLVPVGGGWRPGALGSATNSIGGHPVFRMGELGVWLEFESISLPRFEFLSAIADTVETVHLDLIQTRKGPG